MYISLVNIGNPNFYVLCTIYHKQNLAVEFEDLKSF